MTREALHVGRRALGREHFAFYRGVLEGLSPDLLWDRFLGLEGDYSEPLAQGTLHWIRQELLTLARERRPQLLGLLRRDPRRMKTARLPSLDEFAETLGETDFYSQAELAALWREQVGPRDVRAAERRHKLQERLRAAIQELEAGYTKAPALAHHLAQWLVPALAQRLGAAGLATLGDLVERRRTRGERWWAGIERVGEVGGTRLTGWLDAHFPAPPSSPEVPVPPSAAELYGVAAVAALRASVMPPPAPGSARSADPDRPASTDGTATAASVEPVIMEPSAEDRPAPSPASSSPALRPFSSVAPEVDAAVAATPHVLIAAANDEAAIKTWLGAKATNANTRRTYEREAQRLFLWCHQERGKGFKDLMVEDCTAYRLWVSQLGRLTPDAWDAVGWRVPQSAWIGPRGPARESPDWRAFEGPLLHGSQAHAVKIAAALFEFLRQGGYLANPSPWGMIGKPALPAVAGEDADTEALEDQFVARSFSREQLAFVLDQARERGPGDRSGDAPAEAPPGPLQRASARLARRLELVLWLGVGCGLRAAEMCSLDLASLRIDDQRGWRLRVVGKGSKTRTLPLPTPAVDALVRYAAACDIDEARLRILAAARRREPLLRVHSNRARVNGKTGPQEPVRLGYRGLYAALTKFMKGCGALLAISDPEAARRLDEGSTHWLRHTFATLMLESGEKLNVVQAMLDHADLATTGRYVRAKQRTMQDAVERFAKATAAFERGEGG